MSMGIIITIITAITVIYLTILSLKNKKHIRRRNYYKLSNISIEEHAWIITSFISLTIIAQKYTQTIMIFSFTNIVIAALLICLMNVLITKYYHSKLK